MMPDAGLIATQPRPTMIDRLDTTTQHRLLSLIEGELSASERAQLEAILRERPDLRELIDQMRDDRTILRSLPHEAPATDLAAAAIAEHERALLLAPDDEPIGRIGGVGGSTPRAATRPAARRPHVGAGRRRGGGVGGWGWRRLRWWRSAPGRCW